MEVAVEVTEGDDMEEVQGEMEVLPLTFVVLFFLIISDHIILSHTRSLGGLDFQLIALWPCYNANVT